jgi:hypothetical protein
MAPPKSKVDLYAAIRRDSRAGMSHRALMREHGVGFRTVKAALESVWPELRKRLFQVLTEREEKNSVAIASNESFGGWTKTFTDPRLCAAIVDRLTFGGNIIETGSDSYRLASTRAAQAQNATTS